MSDLKHKRAAYIDAVTLDRKRKKLLTEWERRVSHARQAYVARPSATLRRDLDHAYRMRRHRRRLHDQSHAEVKYRRRVYLTAKELGSRSDALKWALAQVGTTERTGNNDGATILGWQRATARGAHYLDRAPYCGIGCENAARRAGVKTSPRWASVGFIEDDARAKRGGFTGWTGDPSKVKPGDLVVLFGRGIHVEMVRSIKGGVVKTVGFNTSPGNGGSQSNGGGVYMRQRPLSQVHGFALVNYPT